MIRITAGVTIHDDEISFRFVRSSGPGGQNVNKVATAAQLKFNVKQSPSLPEEVKQRLLLIAKKQINQQGYLSIIAKRYRTQEANRKDALARFVKLIKKATIKPKLRKKLKVSVLQKQKRLEEKRKRSAVKKLRKQVGEE